jgi:hypothetical protein
MTHHSESLLSVTHQAPSDKAMPKRPVQQVLSNKSLANRPVQQAPNPKRAPGAKQVKASALQPRPVRPVAAPAGKPSNRRRRPKAPPKNGVRATTASSEDTYDTGEYDAGPPYDEPSDGHTPPTGSPFDDTSEPTVDPFMPANGATLRHVLFTVRDFQITFSEFMT